MVMAVGRLRKRTGRRMCNCFRGDGQRPVSRVTVSGRLATPESGSFHITHLKSGLQGRLPLSSYSSPHHGKTKRIYGLV